MLICKGGGVVVGVADDSSMESFLKDFRVLQVENDKVLNDGGGVSGCVEDICNDISFFCLNHPDDVGGMLRIGRCCAENSLLMLSRAEVRVKNLQQVVEIGLGVLKR